MANPLLDQGRLNRLVASISFTRFPGLNITPSFLAPEAIRLALEGNAMTRLPTMTGMVISPEPYQFVSCSVHLNKAMALAAAWQQQYNSTVVIGDYTVYPDVDPSQGGIGPYEISNGAIYSLREMSFTGNDVNWAINLTGYVNINQLLWQAA